MLIAASFNQRRRPSIGRRDMTTLAPPPPHLARLFNRLDSADASDPLLRLELEFWRHKCDGRLMPTAEDVALGPGSIAAPAFTFRRSGETNDWEATDAGPEAVVILGLASPDKRLSKLLAPRIAARLRRLLRRSPKPPSLCRRRSSFASSQAVANGSNFSPPLCRVTGAMSTAYMAASHRGLRRRVHPRAEAGLLLSRIGSRAHRPNG